MDVRTRKLVIIAVIAAFVVGAVVLFTRGDRSRDLVLQLEPINPTDDITVYVGGAVVEPGLYSLPRNFRLSQAIELAGPLDSADLTALDLASTLHDEQTIFVPEPGVVAEAEADSGRSHEVEPGAVVDINRATPDELQLLPGIGPALAERIIEHRDARGPFGSVDDLTEISGISDRIVDNLRDLAIASP